MFRIWRMLDFRRVSIMLLIMLVEAAGILLLPTLGAAILNVGAANGMGDAIWRYGSYMAISTVVTIIAAIVSVFLTARESQGLGNKLRKLMFDKIMAFSQDDLAKFETSTLITRTTNDIMQIQLVTMMVMRLVIMAPIMILVSTYFAYQTEPRLAWVFGITLPLISVIVFIIMRKANPIFRSIQAKMDNLNKIFREGLTGIRVIRAFNTTKYEEDRFDAANSDFRQTNIKAYTIIAFLLPSLLLLVGVSNILIFTSGSSLIEVGSMQVGNLTAYIQYSFQILLAILYIGMLFMFLPRAEVSSERVLEVLDTEVSIKNVDNPHQLEKGQDITLDFNEVSFGFPGAERPAVKDIDFSVQQGETLAIIGGTGSGKTTIANLIPRLYEATQGSVRINGVDVKLLEQGQLREHVGYATQNAVLFSGTIRSNLLYGKEDATDEELWRALEIAQAEFVKDLPHGLDSRVEQRGRNYSGGQRQRLSIARVLVSQPDIYVFDDTFSALDFKTDARLRKALKPVTRNAISIIIAQRVNTVMDADTILVLDNGQIVGQGTHQELLETNDVYRGIVDSQVRKESDADGIK